MLKRLSARTAAAFLGSSKIANSEAYFNFCQVVKQQDYYAFLPPFALPKNMTFELKTKLSPAVSGPSTHKLERTAFWQWWQLSQAFKIIPKRTQDPFRNDALRASLSFLIICPLHVAFMLHLALPSAIAEHKELALLQLVGMTALVWLSQAWLFFLAARRHARIAQEVLATESVLEIRSPFFTKKVHWHQINDVFQVGNVDSGAGMFVVECNNGESFLLSEKLNQCNRLVAYIESKLSRSMRPSFEINYRIGDGFFDAANMAGWAIMIALSFALIKQPKPPSAIELLIAAGVTALVLAHRWFIANKMVQLARLNQSELFLKTRSQSQLIALDQVKEIKRIGPLMILKSRSNWFALMLSKKEPINEKLLEYKENLLIGKR